MTGIGISRKKPSGLRDWGKIPVGMAGLKNPINIGDPLILLFPNVVLINFQANTCYSIIYNLYIDFLDFPVILSTSPFINDMTQLD